MGCYFGEVAYLDPAHGIECAQNIGNREAGEDEKEIEKEKYTRRTSFERCQA